MRSLISCYLLSFPLFSVFFPLLFGFWWNKKEGKGRDLCRGPQHYVATSVLRPDFCHTVQLRTQNFYHSFTYQRGAQMDRLQQTMALLITTFGLFLLLLPQVQCQTAGTYVIIGVLGLSSVPIMCECMYVCVCDGAVLLLLSFFARIVLADFAVLENCALSAMKRRELLVCRRKEVNLRVVFYTSH